MMVAADHETVVLDDETTTQREQWEKWSGLVGGIS
jgi:hypothetical protein